jgi:hypothetical protein
MRPNPNPNPNPIAPTQGNAKNRIATRCHEIDRLEVRPAAALAASQPYRGAGTGRGKGRTGVLPPAGNWMYGATTNGGADSCGSSTGAAIGGAATIGSCEGGALSNTVPL